MLGHDLEEHERSLDLAWCGEMYQDFTLLEYCWILTLRAVMEVRKVDVKQGQQ